MAKRLIPLFNKVLVEKIVPPSKTIVGILLHEKASKLNSGKVIAVGTGTHDLNGCLPNLVSYQAFVGGLSGQGLYDEAKSYLKLMVSKGFSPHVSVWHVLINELCSVRKVDDACLVLVGMLKSGEGLHVNTWMDVIDRICEVDIGRLEDVLKVEITPYKRIVDAGLDLQEYLVKGGQANDKFKSRREKV